MVKSGSFCFNFTFQIKEVGENPYKHREMGNLLGEYACKLDAKGRVMLPVALKKQVQPAAQNKFVINRGFEKHLNLYPLDEWQLVSAEVNKLNPYVAKNREFMRAFFRGATELELDNTARLLMPKPLLEYADVGSELVLYAYGNKIEVWSKERYDKLMSGEPADFGALAEEVMGKIRNNDSGDVS